MLDEALSGLLVEDPWVYEEPETDVEPKDKKGKDSEKAPS